MVKYHAEVVQGSAEWMAMRCGILTASEMKLAVTPTLKIADNDKTRQHIYELLAQRITKYAEPHYVSDAMLRGHEDEIDARLEYAQHYAPVREVGFITNDKWGFTIGYSPDGLVGDDGLIEAKSCSQKYQIQTLCDYVSADTIDPDFMIQVQTGLMVSERKFCDLISYCGGLWMATVRVLPNEKIQGAILEAAGAFEQRLAEKLAKYEAVITSKARLIKTVRKIEEQMI